LNPRNTHSEFILTGNIPNPVSHITIRLKIITSLNQDVVILS